MLNARIRKIFAQKGIPIFSIVNPDLTYDYKIIGEKTDDIEDLINKKINFLKNFYHPKTNSNNWRVALEMKSGKYILKK